MYVGYIKWNCVRAIVTPQLLSNINPIRQFQITDD